MTYTRLDLSRQAKLGAAFALPLAAGGTARVDGVGRGVVVRVVNAEPSGSIGNPFHNYVAADIDAGMPLKALGFDALGVLAVQPTTDDTDTPVGVALEDISPGRSGLMMVLGYATVLVTGTVTAGDPLYASDTDGVAAATAAVGGRLGFAVTDDDAGSVTALVMPGTGGTGGSSPIFVDADFCQPITVVSPEVVEGYANAFQGNTNHVFGVTVDGSPGSVLIVLWSGASVTDMNWQPDGTTTGQQAFTMIASSGDMQVWRLIDPDPGDANGEVAITSGGSSKFIGVAYISGLADPTAIRGTAFASGTSGIASNPIATVPGDRVLNIGGWLENDQAAGDIINPTAGGGQTTIDRDTLDVPSGQADSVVGFGHQVATSDITTPTWAFSGSHPWTAIAIAFKGEPSATGDAHVDIVGTATDGLPRCDHKHHVRRAWAPGVNDDAEHGYPVGTMWTNTVTQATYVSLSDAAGAALWVLVGGPFLIEAAIPFIIDGGGVVITTGVKGHVEVPFDCTIVSARLFADVSGSIVVDIWRDSYANFPPADADSITASAPPTLSSAVKSQDTTLTGWSKSLVAGDVLAFNVDSATTVTRVTLSLLVVRTP